MKDTLKYLQQLHAASLNPQLALVKVTTHHNLGYILSGMYVEGPRDQQYPIDKIVNLKESDTVVMSFQNAGRKLVFSCRHIKETLIKAGGSATDVTVECGEYGTDHPFTVRITVRRAEWSDVKLEDLLK